MASWTASRKGCRRPRKLQIACRTEWLGPTPGDTQSKVQNSLVLHSFYPKEGVCPPINVYSRGQQTSEVLKMVNEKHVSRSIGQDLGYPKCILLGQKYKVRPKPIPVRASGEVASCHWGPPVYSLRRVTEPEQLSYFSLVYRLFMETKTESIFLFFTKFHTLNRKSTWEYTVILNNLICMAIFLQSQVR